MALNFVLPPQTPQISVIHAPVLNILNTIALIPGSAFYELTDTWPPQVEAALPPEHRQALGAIIWGLGIDGLLNAVDDAAALPDFPAYLGQLAAQEAVYLRDNFVDWFLKAPRRRLHRDDPTPQIINPLQVSEADYVAFLLDWIEKPIDAQTLRLAYTLYHNPFALKSTLLQTLNFIWREHIQPDWVKSEPIIRQSVAAFQAMPLQDLPLFEAMRVITGRNLQALFLLPELMKFQQICFLPSRHNGPYLSWFTDERSLYIGFGLRMPGGVKMGDSLLDNAELLNRLRALADETRLQILSALKAHQELSTAQIMEMFDLNKSAASRHLRNLYASGFIHERRDDDNKSKFYSLNADCLRETMQAIGSLMP